MVTFLDRQRIPFILTILGGGLSCGAFDTVCVVIARCAIQHRYMKHECCGEKGAVAGCENYEEDDEDA